AQISLILFEVSSFLLADSAIYLVDRVHRTVYSKLLLKFFLLPFVDDPSLLSWAWIVASPSEVLVLLVLEDVPLYHFWEYSAISWMVILASAAVLEGHFISNSLNLSHARKRLSSGSCWKLLISSIFFAVRMTDTPYSIDLNTSYRIQYAVLGRRFDTSYPTGGYDVSCDQSEQNTIKNN
ncbi:hypothetical protein Tco_1479042, partial [Tanacetum coccineum]